VPNRDGDRGGRGESTGTRSLSLSLDEDELLPLLLLLLLPLLLLPLLHLLSRLSSFTYHFGSTFAPVSPVFLFVSDSSGALSHPARQAGEMVDLAANLNKYGERKKERERARTRGEARRGSVAAR